MASPVFSSNKAFQPGQTVDVNGQPVSAADLQSQFDQPAADAHQMGRMTYEGVISKTAMLLVLAFVLAIPGYVFPIFPLVIGAAVVGLVLGLVIAFSRTTNPALVVTYAAIEGYFLGGITVYIETSFDVQGAGLQALFATASTFAVVLWLYKSGRVRYTSKMRKFLIVGGLSYLAFSLVNVGVMIFGSSDAPWGMRSVEIAGTGIPLGLLVGGFAVILACVSLIADFDFIENGVKNGLPSNFEWRAAFGLVVTLVWLYIEFLRIIAIVMGRR